MSLVTFTCPGCQSTLKSPTAIAAGKKIRCPKCGTTFLMPEQDEGDEPALVEDDRPAFEEDRSDDHDDEPVERELRRPRKRRRKKQGRGLATALTVVGILLGLAVLGGGAYFAWAKLAGGGRNAGTGNELPLAYVPAGSSAVMFINFETLMNMPTVGRQIEQSLTQTQGGSFFADCKRETGLEFKDLLNQVTYGFKVPDFTQLGARQAPQGMTAVIKSRVPFDQRKIARSAKGAVAKKMKGKTYYEITDNNFRYLFMPSDWIMVLTNVPENELAAIVGSGGTEAALPAETLAMARGAEDCQFWVVAPITGAIQQSIQLAVQNVPGEAPPGLKGVVAALPSAKAAGMWAKVDGDKVRFTIGLACQDEAAAKVVAGQLQGLWDEKTKGPLARAQLLAGMAFMGQGIAGVTKEVIESTQFANRGAVAQATAQMNTQSLEQAFREGQAQALNMQNPAAFPRPGMSAARPFPPQGVPPARPVPAPGMRRPLPPGGPRR